jgi:arsenite-transporting ATPase
MQAQIKHVFFLGKGGVGKSTLSALSAVYLAQKEKRVYLISMDPAHNQGDIFAKKITQKVEQVDNNLFISEIDLHDMVKIYLKGVEDQINHAYRYLTAFNLEKYTGIIKYSPGIQEYALLLGYNNLIKQFKSDFIIFDMPPTALALKFFNLPTLSLLWLNKLVQLRNELLTKRKIITKIKFGKKEIDTDKVLQELHKQMDFYHKIQATFQDNDKTVLNIVINPDQLSVLESKDIIQALSDINITQRNVILNKFQDSDHDSEFELAFQNVSMHKVENAAYSLIGLEALKKYLGQNSYQFTFL